MTQRETAFRPRASARIILSTIGLIVAAFALLFAVFASLAPARTAYADAPVKEGVPYALVSASNTRLAVQLGNAGGLPVSGVQATLATRSIAATQAFIFQQNADGSYRIASAANPSILLTADELDFHGAVTGNTRGSGGEQAWRIETLDDGNVRLWAAAGVWMLDVNGSSARNGAACGMWFNENAATQKWQLEELDPVMLGGTVALFDSADGTIYTLANSTDSGLAVQTQGVTLANGDAVIMGTSDAQAVPANQGFLLDRQADGTYFVRSAANADLYLTADALSMRGATMLATRDASRAQSWYIRGYGDGTYQLMTAAEGAAWVLDVDGSAAQAGAGCILWSENGGATQRWTITAAQTVETANEAEATGETGEAEAETAAETANETGATGETVGEAGEAEVETAVEAAPEPAVEVVSAPEPEPAVGPEPAPADLTFAESSAATENGTWYRIVSSSNPGLAVRIDASYTATGAAMALAYVADDIAELFSITDAGDGFVYIRPAFNTSLQLTADALDFRGTVAGRSLGEGAEQRWRIEELADGTCRIWAADSIWMLDTAGSRQRAGAACMMWFDDNGSPTQYWTLVPVDAASAAAQLTPPAFEANAAYRVSNVSNPDVAVSLPAEDDVFGAAAGMAASAANYDAHQAFLFDEQPDGSYLIRSAAQPELYLTAYEHDFRAPISAWTRDASRAQAWVLQSYGDGTFRVALASDTYWVLDVDGSATEAGSPCILWGANGSDTQRWTFAKVASGVGEEPAADEGEEAPNPAAARIADFLATLDEAASVAADGAAEAAAEPVEPSPAAEPAAAAESAAEPDSELASELEPEPEAAPAPVYETIVADTLPTDVAGTGALFRLHSFANPNLVLQLDETAAAGSGLALAEATDAASQVFTFAANADGTVSIVSYDNPALCVMTTRASKGWPAQGRYLAMPSAYTGWAVDTGESTTPGVFALRLAGMDGPALGVEAPEAGRQVQLTVSREAQSTSLWTLEAVTAAELAEPLGMPDSADGAMYRFVNASNPDVVVALTFPQDGESATATVAERSEAMASSETFILEAQPNDTYFIRSSLRSEYYLTADALWTHGTVSAWTRDRSKAQTWRLERQADGTFHVCIAGTGWMLDTSGSEVVAGASCIMWFDNGGSTQKWAIEQAISVEDPTVGFTEAAPDPAVAARAARAATAQAVLTVELREQLAHGEKDASHTRWIVLHDTGDTATAEQVIDGWTADAAREAAHFVINKDGTIWQCVSLDQIAHHAGYGDEGAGEAFAVPEDGRDDMRGRVAVEGNADCGMDAWSVGIALVHAAGEEGGYPEEQLTALDNLIAYIDSYYGFACPITVERAWNSSVADTAKEFDPFLANYQDHRTHVDAA